MLEPRHELVGNALVNDQPPKRRATLTRRTHGRKQDRTFGEGKVGRRADDHRIVAAKLEREGVEKFEASWNELLDGVRSELEKAAA